MVRVIIAVTIFASVLGGAAFVEVPAAPNVTNCDQALMGYAYAEYALNNCSATFLHQCDEEIAAVAAAMDNVAIFCGIEEIPY
jgi:hypothetical protein